jgi:2-oxoisovalerate dehydrogenase E1 component
MLQLLAKGNDIFTGGREYYNHPNYRGVDKPTIIHQSSATGMQAIPTTGIAQGIQYLEKMSDVSYQMSENTGNEKSIKSKISNQKSPVVVCCFGDGSITEGEVREAFSFAALKQLPIIYLVEDNDWGISVSSDEARTNNAYEYIAGFKGIERMQVDGSDFEKSYSCIENAIHYVRENRKPILIHAKVPLLGHHTSGVRKEWYRNEDDLAKHEKDNPITKLHQVLIKKGISAEDLKTIEEEERVEVYIEAKKRIKRLFNMIFFWREKA